MFKSITVIIFSTLFMAFSSSSLASDNFVSYHKNSIVEHQGKSMWLDEYGSGTQWNDDYVVTAKHLTPIIKKGLEYSCPNSCDIVFVKSKAKGNTPLWRDRVAGEIVTISGINQEGKSSSATGKDLNNPASVWNNQDIITYLTSADTSNGMSGGPVTAEDGKVIGILTGNVNLEKAPDSLKALSDKKSISIYIPYAEIQKQWDIFQQSKQ